MNAPVSRDPTSPRSVILFQQMEVVKDARASAFHCHDFWQMEWNRKGTWEMRTSAGIVSLRPDDVVFFPPGTRHGFSYAGHGESYLSVKFHAEGMPALPDRALIVPKNTFFKTWLACLSMVINTPALPHPNLVLAGLIDSLLVQLLPPVNDPVHLPVCVRRARAFIEANAGQAITVVQTAGAAGVTAGYLVMVFRSSTGRTVKQAIDHQRLELARSLLRYADISIGETALQVGFPDIYAFSRFFKRHTGKSPTEFRRLSGVRA